MKATGIVRRIDDLGRVVIPKEIRRTMRIREGEPMEIFTGREGEIVLKKYSPIEELESISREYVQALAQTLGCLACVSDHDMVVAAAGPKQQEYQGKHISKILGEKIQERDVLLLGDKKRIQVLEDEKDVTGAQIICPILSAGDVIGSVFLINKKDGSDFNEVEKKSAQVAARFLGQQMES
ncbi:MAG: stage V sporulation T C-terminal domain-containing protein [Ruminococcus sp.]|nr:stage V sporulation T C-terminal domain-containing protein [Ruminococcus sp.]